ncbi:MAG: hypothetical protein AB7R87_07345, partial [Parvibaculaceae bacterium]
PDKPLAILCNPPYRNDDDQTANAASYAVHHTITAITGIDAASERYCSFLAQMKLVCEVARSSGLPGESLLLLFTKSAWLTNRTIFQQIRGEIVGVFENIAGFLVDGSEFFDIRGKWPVAFTIWRHKGPNAELDASRAIRITDLTWLKRRELEDILWADAQAADVACRQLYEREQSKAIELGHRRRSIRVWSGYTMVDFKRDRRRSEAGQAIVGGLPWNDRRRANKKTYGESDGEYVGFMDDLTPCRIKRSLLGRPWFRLNAQFMDIRKNRCFSGPPTHWGYCAENLEGAKRLFFWYALTRTFVQMSYPMWADAEDLWEPFIPSHLEERVFTCSAAIVFAENECVETYFPANNPIRDTREIFVRNPLTPLDQHSFWSETICPNLKRGLSPAGDTLIEAVNNVFAAWSDCLGRKHELPIGYNAPYFVDRRCLTRTAGLVQIRDYCTDSHVETLRHMLDVMQSKLKGAKRELFEVTTAESGLNYFGHTSQTQTSALPGTTSFEKVLSQRLALAGLIVRELHAEPNFGRTKLAKLFYLADKRAKLQLQTNYVREAAGPLDQRALYNERIGIETLAQKYQIFKPTSRGRMVRYEVLSRIDDVDDLARAHLSDKQNEILRIIGLCRNLTTDQAEIVTTLYACWNDLMIRKEQITDDAILREFLNQWHPKKARFSRKRLHMALGWMRELDLTPLGRGSLTGKKHT